MKVDLTHKTYFLEYRDADIFEDWLRNHEQDIALGMNDFGRLRMVFTSVIGRPPQEINTNIVLKGE